MSEHRDSHEAIWKKLFGCILYQLYQVEVHQTAVERTLRLDTPELTLLFLCTEEVVEAIALVEGKIAFLVIGINKKKRQPVLLRGSTNQA